MREGEVKMGKWEDITKIVLLIYYYLEQHFMCTYSASKHDSMCVSAKFC